MLKRWFFIWIFLACSTIAFCQQDIDFHLNAHYFKGRKILRVKRDFHDPYLWVLGQHNEVYRINSQTQVIDNYSAKFAAYRNLEFIDIAGQSGDTVFIATKSLNVIQYEKGTIQLLSANIGIKGIVTSVGIDYTGRLLRYDGTLVGHMLLIGTERGARRYNMDDGTATAGSDDLYSQIFEATYRKITFSGQTPRNSPDTVIYYPFESNDAITIFNQNTFLGGKQFGTQLNTVFYMPSGYNEFDFTLNSFSFWGTETGMSQNNRNFSYSAVWPSAHYLNNIKVNKITDLFGLTAFGYLGQYGNGGLIKQNLLIGTDNGLYFSKSIFRNSNGYTNALHTITLYHYDEIGTVRINDICVNTESIIFPNICEDGAWLAADDGLYLIKPDYSSSLNHTQLELIKFDGQPDDLNFVHLCQGETIDAVLNSDSYTGRTVQWYKDGVELPGAAADKLTITGAGDYSAVLYDPCQNLHVESNHLKVDVIGAPVFSFNYPDFLPLCDNSPYTLQTDYNPGYQYRWYQDNTLTAVSSNAINVTVSGKYRVEVSACSGNWVSSKEITVQFINLPVPVLSADKSGYCYGETANLTIDVPAQNNYTISWYKDGAVLSQYTNRTAILEISPGSYQVKLTNSVSACVQSSEPLALSFTAAPVFTFNYPSKLQYCKGSPLVLKAAGDPSYRYRWMRDGILTGDVASEISIIQSGKYHVEVNNCGATWIPSADVDVSLIDLPTPVLSADKIAYCVGDNASLKLQIPPDPAYSINWYKDNILIAGNFNSNSLVTNEAGNYAVSIVSNSVNTDGSVCKQQSSAFELTFTPPPVVSIEKIVPATSCQGQDINLIVHYTGGKVLWSTGETSDQITVKTSGIYSVNVTTASGCQVEKSIDVEFLPLPVINISDAAICEYKHESVVIQAPSGYSRYIWNGQEGSTGFPVSKPGTVNLAVIDANGCMVNKTITIADQCPQVKIPNTFTPNNDGINDTWIIDGLTGDDTAVVNVFNRYGTLIFHSNGYGIPWNGEYNGKKLPPGVYYYIVTAKKNEQKFSGSLTILY